MLIDLKDLARKYPLDRVTGVLHVGAHLGEEQQIYHEVFGDVLVGWVEADPQVHAKLAARLRFSNNHKVIKEVVSALYGEEVTFHRANNGQSSSILDLKTHLLRHPEVSYVDEFTTHTTTMDALIDTYGLWDCNFLNLDVQGAEGKVIWGGARTIGNFDFIYSEVNVEELYEGCMLLPEFDEFLDRLGFDRKETFIHDEFGWGDAFYIRRGL